MMQLEEVNRATNQEMFDLLMRKWVADRGLPTEDEWNFQVMMQYCERLEEEIRLLQEQCEIWEACMREEVPGHLVRQPGTRG